MAYHRTHGVDVRIVRIFNTYGERMRPDDGRVVNTFVVQALRGEPITLHGDGTPDAQLLPRRRRDRRSHRRARRSPHRPGQRRQPRRVHDARAGRARHRAHRLVERDRLGRPAARARGRPAAAPAGHHADRVHLRLAPADPAARRPRPDDPLLRRAGRDRRHEHPRHRWRRVHRLAHRAPPHRPGPRGRRPRLDGVRPPRRGDRGRAGGRRHRRRRPRRRPVRPPRHHPGRPLRRVQERRRVDVQPVALLDQQRHRHRRSSPRRSAPPAIRRDRVLLVLLGLRHAGGRPGHRGGTDPAGERLRRVEGDDRAHPALVRADPRPALGQPALLQRRRGQRRQPHRRGLERSRPTSCRWR